MLVGTRELVVVDGMGTKPLLEVKGAPPLVEEREVRSPVILCSKRKPCPSRCIKYTHGHVVFIGIIGLVRVLLSRPDVLDLADTRCASGRIRVAPLSFREPAETEGFVASGTFKLRERCSGAVAADHFVEYLLVTQSCAVAQHKLGIILAAFGEAGEGAELRTSLAPNPAEH